MAVVRAFMAFPLARPAAAPAAGAAARCASTILRMWVHDVSFGRSSSSGGGARYAGYFALISPRSGSDRSSIEATRLPTVVNTTSPERPPIFIHGIQSETRAQEIDTDGRVFTFGSSRARASVKEFSISIAWYLLPT